MMKIQKNYQKPIDIDAHFKYKCPNKDCFNEHWLSIKEVSIPNFKVVCEYCGIVFSPYNIVKICVYYTKDIIDINENPKVFSLRQYKKIKPEEPPKEQKQTEPEKTIVVETIDQTKDRFIETMKELGFDNTQEILEMFDRAYTICPTNDIKTLFKIAVLES